MQGKTTVGQQCLHAFKISLKTELVYISKAHQPATGKYHPISPAFPLLKYKEGQGHRCRAMGSQCLGETFVRENLFHKHTI